VWGQEEGKMLPGPVSDDGRCAVIMKPVSLHYAFIGKLTREEHTWEYSPFVTWTTT